MVVIEIKEEDKEKVLAVLLNNGRFRSLGKNKFDIIDHVDEVLEKLKKEGIEVKKEKESELE